MALSPETFGSIHQMSRLVSEGVKGIIPDDAHIYLFWSMVALENSAIEYESSGMGDESAIVGEKLENGLLKYFNGDDVVRNLIIDTAAIHLDKILTILKANIESDSVQKFIVMNKAPEHSPTESLTQCACNILYSQNRGIIDKQSPKSGVGFLSRLLGR